MNSRNGRNNNPAANELAQLNLSIYKDSGISNEDREKIINEFEKLITLRNEELSEYSFDALFDFWNAEGYSKNDVLEMLHMAKSLPKKGNAKLGTGDLVTVWKKNREKSMGISWQEFNKAFKVMCELNFELLNKACIELTGIGLSNHDDKIRIFNFLKKQMEAIELERSKVEYENKFNNDRAIINWRERGEISLKVEKIINEVKLELIDWFLITYERRKALNHLSPAGHIYDLKEKLKSMTV